MALTGIEIFKYLPKTNCAECGIATCLAFAMNVAAAKTGIDKCPYISDQIKETLVESSAPPVRQILFGTGSQEVKLGGESVLFRHERRFENQTAIGLLLTTGAACQVNDDKVASFKELRYERAGHKLAADFFFVENDNNSSKDFLNLLMKVKDIAALAVCAYSLQDAKQAMTVVGQCKPLLCGALEEDLEGYIALAKQYGCPLAIVALSLPQARAMTQKALSLGFKDLVFSVGTGGSVAAGLEFSVETRNAAVKDKDKLLGFPTLLYPCAFNKDLPGQFLNASILMAKYASALVMSEFKGQFLYPLLTARLNIFTDPQRPLTMPQSIYTIGKADENSPVVLSCNFALTYFIVSAEIENSMVPAHFIIKDTEGLSVLTAWAAGKFSADSIAAYVKKSGIADKVTHRKLIIPGYVSIESAALEEELPGWQVIVGPQDAAALPAFLKQWSC
ncbi:MAG: acetyl-CoA decarbonylase/synthase complex subunit gamma [Chloroflexi bacterium]|nr:acetyl-CoA decarbonylase/synthase complex subunit gamma [Chloroflexota bacterium]